MALHRGIQSAIFYYLSCAPCTGHAYRKKRRKEADRDRAHKHQLEMEQPGLYRHPSPFATNPNWQTEIDAGPHPAAARRKKDNKKSTRTRPSAENESTVASTVSLPLVQGESNDSVWNLKRYQREDEDLWGANLAYRSSRTSGLEGSVINGKGGISRPATARTNRTEKTSTSYYSANNPPISDLHPAIVTRIDTREDAMWMLQPPPTARVMSGREKPPPTRHRSDSASSRVSSRRGDYSPLSRQVSQRIIDEKLKSGELPPSISLSRDSSKIDKTARSMSSAENLSSDEALWSRRRRRPPPISVSEDTHDLGKTIPSQRLTVKSDATANSTTAGVLRPRRALSPVASENSRSRRSLRGSSTSRARDASAHTECSEMRQSGRRPALGAKDRQDSSLNVLQELVPSSLLNFQMPAISPTFEARIELPSSDSTEEMELLGSGKAAFESWYTRDVDQFPQWVSERTKRDVTARWSVDF